MRTFVAFLGVVTLGFASIAEGVILDTVAGPILIIADERGFFEAKGTLTTTDMDVPPNGMSGPALFIDGVNWELSVRHRVSGWGQLPGFPAGTDGALNARIGISGLDGHVHGPHRPPKPPPHDDDPNPLPIFESAPASIQYGAAQRLTAWGSDPHALIGGGGNHVDQYGVTQLVKAELLLPAMTPRLTGDTQSLRVLAHHTPTGLPKFESVLKGLAMGSNRFGPGASLVAFDAATGKLSFTLGSVNVLDSQGGLTGGVAAQYAGDPLLNGVWTVSDLDFLGLDASGAFLFSGGSFTIVDPAGGFAVEGSFGEYRIRNTTATTAVNSYALLDSLSITDFGDVTAGASLFLQDFVNLNMFGPDGLASEFIQGMDFTFITDSDFAQATLGFTQSATRAATVQISLNGSAPVPGTILLVAGGLAALFPARLLRRARKSGKR